MNAYEVLSKFYEKIILDDNYANWTEKLFSKLDEYVKDKTCIDCACGSGIFTRLLKQKGYDVVGVDISENMLMEAQKISKSQRLNIQFLKEDIKSLKTFNKVGAITCVNDGLNYILQKDINKVFKSFNKCLQKGGILLFDVSSEYKLKNVLADNAYCDDDENLSYIWLNKYNSQLNGVEISLSFFEKDGNKYSRFDETQIEYVHTQTEIENALRDNGFSVLSVTDENFDNVKQDTQRLVFIAVKN